MSDARVAELEDRNRALLAVLQDARNMLLALRPEVERMERRDHFNLLLKRRQFRLGSLRQQWS